MEDKAARTNSLVLVDRLMGHEERVWCVRWNPPGTLLASCGGDKKIIIWGAERARDTSSSLAGAERGEGERWVAKVVLEEGHSRTVRGLAWSPSGLYLASCSFDKTICIWKRQLEAGAGADQGFTAIATLEGHENEVKAVAWSVSGQYLASCSRDKSVWIWSCEYDDEYDCLSVLHSHSQDVKRVAWSPVEDVLVSCSYDNTIKLFKDDPNDDDWTCTDTLPGHDSTVWAVCFDHSGRRLASCSDDNTIKIWQYFHDELEANPHSLSSGDAQPERKGGEWGRGWRCVCTLSGQHSRTIFDLDWSHVHGALASASADDGLRVFEENTAAWDRLREPEFNLAAHQRQAHAQDVNAVAWNPSPAGGNLLATCGDDGLVQIWRYTKPEGL